MADGFDLQKFKSMFTEPRKNLVFMARQAENAERYDDMCKFMRELVEECDKKGEGLTVEERNLLSVAYKNVIGTRRASWRTLNSPPESDSKDNQKELIQEYKTQVEAELKATCEDVLDLLETKLVGSKVIDVLKEGGEPECPDKGEPLVFFLKMTGDYYRYLAESVVNDAHAKNAAQFYEWAYKLAAVKLKSTHPIRLGLALNYSVCYYEILKNKQKACDLAKNAFDSAISLLDTLEESDYKDSTLIMQLLRDNLTLWTSSDPEPEEMPVEDLSGNEEEN